MAVTEEGVTVVDSQAMGEAVNSYKKNVTEIQNIMQAMKGIQTALSAANIFTGGAASTMITAIGAYVTALEGATGSLNGVIKILEGKIAKYNEAEKNAAAEANSIEPVSWPDDVV